MRPLKYGVSIGMRAAAIACCMAFAANAAPAQPPAKPAPVAPAVKDDPAKVAAAHEFLLAYKPKLVPANVSALIDKSMPNLVARAKANDPKLDVVKYEKDQRKSIMDMAARTLDMQSHVVSRHFTIQEMKDLQAFYSSPLGKKLLAEAPNIVRDIMIEKQAAKAAVVVDPSKAGPTPPKKK